MENQTIFATRTTRMGASAIREILKVIARPGMISLAGGIPAPESFPLDLMRDLTATVFEKHGPGALQYDASEGFAPLRAALVSHLADKGVNTTADGVAVFSGSQGVLDSLGKILISPGDRVAVEAPTYLGALSAFNPYQPRYLSIETDDDGVIPASLEELIQREKTKFIYLVPTFQNPTGRTLSLERRKEIGRLLQQHNVLLVEDDPYGALRYRGESLPPIQQFAPDHVVYISTLSKTFAPGLRIGFVVAPKEVQDWLVIARQGVDLHTSTFNQALSAEYLEGGHLARQLPKIIDLYKPRQTAMLEALDRHMPDGFRWTRPDGGMFIWLEGPAGVDAEAIYWKAVERNVAFVPGKFFYTDEGAGLATMRLNFTMVDEQTIEGAVHTLSEVVRSSI